MQMDARVFIDLGGLGLRWRAADSPLSRLGVEGHVASLFPGSVALSQKQKWGDGGRGYR
jgi:hypothetical protein